MLCHELLLYFYTSGHFVHSVRGWFRFVQNNGSDRSKLNQSGKTSQSVCHKTILHYCFTDSHNCLTDHYVHWDTSAGMGITILLYHQFLWCMCNIYIRKKQVQDDCPWLSSEKKSEYKWKTTRLGVNSWKLWPSACNGKCSDPAMAR